MRLICSFLVAVLAASIAQSALAGKCGCDESKGYVQCVHEHKSHLDWLCGPPPPDGPVVESVAIQRVSINRETRFHLQQEAGERAPEREKTCGSAGILESLTSSLNTSRIEAFDNRLSTVETRLEHILQLLENQQKLMEVQQELIENIHAPEQ